MYILQYFKVNSNSMNTYTTDKQPKNYRAYTWMYSKCFLAAAVLSNEIKTKLLPGPYLPSAVLPQAFLGSICSSPEYHTKLDLCSIHLQMHSHKYEYR